MTTGRGPHFSGCNFKRVGTIVDGPSTLEPTFNNVNAEDIGTVVRLHDRPRSLIEQLGLPPETDPAVLLEALEMLYGNASKPEKERIADLQASRLGQMLGHAANVATVYPALTTGISGLIAAARFMVGP